MTTICLDACCRTLDSFELSLGVDGAMHFIGHDPHARRLLVSCACDGASRSKWRVNGNLTRVMVICGILGVTEEFCHAIELAVRKYSTAIVDARIEARRDAEDELSRLAHKLRAAELRVIELQAAARSANDIAHATLRELNIAMIASVTPAQHSLDSNDMPEVPRPSFMADSVESFVQPKVSGVYFAWEQPQRVAYVGKSKCIRSRLIGHHVVRPHHAMSYIAFPEDMITPAEHYYIWKLRPRLNDGGRNAAPMTPSQS